MQLFMTVNIFVYWGVHYQSSEFSKSPLGRGAGNSKEIQNTVFCKLVVSSKMQMQSSLNQQ